MLIFLLLSALATSGSLGERWAALDPVAVPADAPARDAAGLSFAAGPGTWTFASGRLYPVRLGEGEGARVAGFAFSGEGTLEIAFADRAEALRAANHLARREETRELARAAAEARRITVPITQGMVLSADPKVRGWLEGQPEAAADEARRAAAAELVGKRLALLADLYDPLRRVRADALAPQDGAAALVADFDTAVSWRLDEAVTQLNRWEDDSWLSLLEDPTITAPTCSTACCAAASATRPSSPP